jgi:hypothetical protein
VFIGFALMRSAMTSETACSASYAKVNGGPGHGRADAVRLAAGSSA